MLYAARKKVLNQLFNKLEIKTTDWELFDEALTHPSFNFEQNKEDAPDYERLEFLGDSVLRLVISNYLYDKYPEFEEGKLTKIRSYLVSDEFLSHIVLDLEINKYINIGVHEEKDGGRTKESILACSLEAVFGAIYKSLDYEAAKTCICNIYDNMNINIAEILYSYNSKEILQQYTQAQNKDLPEYKIQKESGQAHNKLYEVSVFYHNEELGKGIAKTKKEAEKLAAFDAIKKLNIMEENFNG